MTDPAYFDRHGPVLPVSPVVLSVPHTGRDYPLPLRAALRVPLASLLPLEDRHADRLALAARGAETLLVANRARAWIDLNRAEHERDPRIDEGATPIPEGAMSLKLRSGLGLVPRRAGGADLWRRSLYTFWRRTVGPANMFDVANRQTCKHAAYNGACALILPMKTLWLVVYILDAVLVFLVKPGPAENILVGKIADHVIREQVFKVSQQRPQALVL